MMLVDKAAENPRKLKLISVAVHSARPPMTGMRERLTSSPAEGEHMAGLQCPPVDPAAPQGCSACSLLAGGEKIAHACVTHSGQARGAEGSTLESPAPSPAFCTPPYSPQALICETKGLKGGLQGRPGEEGGPIPQGIQPSCLHNQQS